MTVGGECVEWNGEGVWREWGEGRGPKLSERNEGVGWIMERREW